MTSSGLWGEQTAARYDADSADQFAPGVLGPAVDFLARLAGSGAALEFAIGTGRVGIPLAARGVPVTGIELAHGPHPLRGTTVLILSRWLAARAEIIAELEGSDPGHLWIPVKPGRPRGGRPPVKPGLTPAAVRTLHAAHRRLVSHLLGTPLRPGALRGNPIDIAGDSPQIGGS